MPESCVDRSKGMPFDERIMKNLACVLSLIVAWTTSAVVLARPRPDAASSPSEAETLSKVAKERFAAKDFGVAADLFMQAFAKSHNPATLYNAARAYEEAGNKASATSTYKLYIALSTDEAGIRDAKDHMAKLEIPAPVVTSPVIVTPTPAKVAKPTPMIVAKPATQVQDRTMAWLTTGGSVVLVGVGLSMMADGASGTQKYSGVNRASFDSARTEWQMGLGFVCAGAILGGVSAYLWTKPVTVAPTTNGVVVNVGGTF